MDDVPLLVELMEEFYAEAAYPLDRRWASEAFAALLRDEGRGVVWILLHGAQAGGYVVLTVRFSMEVGGLDGFVDDLFVRPRHRRRGLGRAALGALFEECDRRNLLAVHVEVGRGNAAAKALYEAFGLRPRGDDRQLLTVRR
jgi:GNAT superfamily N-acetyltransferase